MNTNKLVFWGTISAIFLLNLISKIYYIADLPLWYDESISLFNTQKNILRVFEYSALDNTPPIYNIFLYLWIKLFGISEFSIRFPSVIFGSITAILVFIYGNRKANYTTGLVAATLYSFSNFCIWYSQDARCYALVMMFSVWSLLVFDQWMSENVPTDKKTKSLIILNTLLLYTHYLTIFILVAQFVCVFLFKRNFFKKYLEILKKTGLYFAIWAFAMIRNIVNINKKFWVPPTSETAINDFLDKLLGIGWDKWLFIGLIIIALVIQIKRRDSVFISLLLFVVIPFVSLIVVSEVMPLFVSRYIIYIFPFTYLLLGYAIYSLHKSPYLQILIGSIFLYTLIDQVDLKQTKGQDIKSIVEKIKNLEKENRTIILQTELSYAMFAYYYNQELFFKDTDEYKSLMNNDKIQMFSRIESMDYNLTNSSSQVFLVNQFSDGSDVKNYLQESKYKLTETQEYGGGLTLTIFEKSGI